MVGVGVAEGGSPGGGAPCPDPYYGEYYPPEQYYVPQEMCPHPQQHPQHAHMCTVHPDYGGMPVVTSGTMIPGMMPPGAVLDENMRYHLVHAHHPHHHAPPPPHHQHQPQPHHQQQHHQPQHHQPPHHFGPTNGASGPQHFYNTGYPPHFHMPPHHMQPSPPPPVYQKDERTQRQYSKLKQKLDRKHNSRNNGIEINSGASTPSLSPRKELNGSGGSGGASSGAWSEGEGSSASTSLQGDEDQDTHALVDMLSSVRTPQVSEVTPNSALVQWTTPIPEGVPLPRTELTYELLLGDRGRGRFKAIYRGTSLSCRVRDLRPGCEYSVCLQVRAGEYTGAASEALTFVAPAAPPERVAQPRVTQRTRTSVLLRWGAAGDNGARLSHYILEMDGGGGFTEISRPRTRQHTANELRPQTMYRFRVAAVNDRGRGEWSPEVIVWTLGAPPPAPPPPRLLDAAPRHLALGWERRAPDDEFTLQMDDRTVGHGYLPVYSGPEERHVCTGLKRATEYAFRLRCETADGQGPWSSEVTYRTLPERPAPPGRPALRGKLHSRAFRLRWEPPADDGGAAIQTYTLQLDDGQGYTEAYWGPDREAHCEHLQPGTTYNARVNCANEAGSSEWSATETITTEAQCPGLCEAPELVGKSRPTTVQLRWKPPSCSGGAPLTQYRVELIPTNGSSRTAYSGPASECTIRDLTPGSEYSVTVVAINKVGAGPASAPTKLTAAPAPPSAPPSLQASATSPRTADLTWESAQENGAPLLDYRLQLAAADRDDAYQDVFRGLDTKHTVVGLTPFSAYFFRVCASNSAGRGPWSAVRDLLTPRAPPAAPLPPHCDPATCHLNLSWTPPTDHGAPLLRYLVSLNDRTEPTADVTPEHRIDGLEPNTEYCVRIAAENELGLGDWSEPLMARTRPPPPPPPHLSCVQRAHNHLKLQWDGAADDSVQYRLEMRAPDSREFRPVYRGSAKFYKVKKLREATAYEFRIRASDDRGGRGEVSSPIEAKTLVAPPVAPRAPVVEALGGSRAGVSWEAGDGQYTVQVCRGGEWRDVWSGAGGQCVVDAPEGGEVAVRVVCARGEGAPVTSPVSRLVLPLLPVAPRTRRRPQRPLPAGRVALLVAGGLAVLAVLVAVVLQRLVDPAP